MKVLTRESMMGLMERGVKMNGATFTEPDAEWFPTMFVEGPAGLQIIALRGFDSSDDNYLRWLKAEVKDMRPTMVGTVIAAWMVISEDGEAPEVSPSEHPDGIEVVVLMVVDPDGWLSRMVEVRRSPDRPPKLGEFRELSPMPRRFFDLVRSTIEP